MFKSLYIILILGAMGCAGTPRWVNGVDRTAHYYQGVGTGGSVLEADRQALFELSANIHGIEVEQIVNLYVSEEQKTQGSSLQSELASNFYQWIRTYNEGKVPAEARVVNRWKGKGRNWSYALVEKPGQVARIDRLYTEAMHHVERHAWVPGWAQFQKKQNRRAWTYLSGVGIGVLGGAAFAILSNDAEQRRDQSNTRIERAHYDDLANRRFWFSSGFYALAGSMYAINVLDGLYAQAQPYQILTQVGPGRFRMAVRF